MILEIQFTGAGEEVEEEKNRKWGKNLWDWREEFGLLMRVLNLINKGNGLRNCTGIWLALLVFVAEKLVGNSYWERIFLLIFFLPDLYLFIICLYWEVILSVKNKEDGELDPERDWITGKSNFGSRFLFHLFNRSNRLSS